MTKYLLGILLYIGVLGFSQETTYDDIQWLSVEEAIAEQKANPDKPMFIDIYTSWCGWCVKMDKSTFKDDEVVAFLNEYFIPVKFDAEQKEDINFNDKTYTLITSGRSKIHSLAYVLLQGEMSYPAYVVLNSDNTITNIIRGYHEADSFLNQL